MVAAVVDGPGAIGFHQNRVVGIGDQIVILPRAGLHADVGHANDRQAIPAFGAHGAAGALLADCRGGFAVAEIAGEKPVRNDRSALRGDAFVIVAKCAEARAVLEARVGDDVDDVGAVLQLAEFFDGEKTHAREIRFHAEHAVELDGMADGFVDLQAELRAFENDRACAFRTLYGGMERDGFFADALGVADQIERLDEFVAAFHVLPAETVRIRALLDFFFCETGGDDSRAGKHFYLMNCGADAGGEKLLDAAEGHGAFG